MNEIVEDIIELFCKFLEVLLLSLVINCHEFKLKSHYFKVVNFKSLANNTNRLTTYTIRLIPLQTLKLFESAKLKFKRTKR